MCCVHWVCQQQRAMLLYWTSPVYKSALAESANVHIELEEKLSHRARNSVLHGERMTTIFHRYIHIYWIEIRNWIMAILVFLYMLCYVALIADTIYAASIWGSNLFQNQSTPPQLEAQTNCRNHLFRLSLVVAGWVWQIRNKSKKKIDVETSRLV